MNWRKLSKSRSGWPRAEPWREFASLTIAPMTRRDSRRSRRMPTRIRIRARILSSIAMDDRLIERRIIMVCDAVCGEEGRGGHRALEDKCLVAPGTGPRRFCVDGRQVDFVSVARQFREVGDRIEIVVWTRDAGSGIRVRQILEYVVARSPGQRIPNLAADERVIARAPIKRILAQPARDRIVSSAARNVVGAAKPECNVETISKVETKILRVASGGANPDLHGCRC